MAPWWMASWQGSCAMGWCGGTCMLCWGGEVFMQWVWVVVGLARCGGACVRWVGTVARFSWGRLVSKSGLHAVLGQC